MVEYADMAIEAGFNSYLDACLYDEGCPERMEYYNQEFTQRVEVKAGDPCSKSGCDGEMVERVNRKTGVIFLGCSKFPQCRNSI